MTINTCESKVMVNPIRANTSTFFATLVLSGSPFDFIHKKPANNIITRAVTPVIRNTYRVTSFIEEYRHNKFLSSWSAVICSTFILLTSSPMSLLNILETSPPLKEVFKTQRPRVWASWVAARSLMVCTCASVSPTRVDKSTGMSCTPKIEGGVTTFYAGTRKTIALPACWRWRFCVAPKQLTTFPCAHGCLGNRFF